MSSEASIIKVSQLCKRYTVYAQPIDRLKQFVLPKLQQWCGLTPKQYYRVFEALNDISFEVKRGETIGIIGRNGSGKSTLLQMICGTLTPTAGTIHVHGRVAALLELGSGFNPEFNGRQNVFLNAALLGLSPQQVQDRFEQIAAFADIGDFMEQPVKTYSSGMLVRLAFAVVAHVDADILVIDEALAVGDAMFTQKCMRFLRSFMRTGTVLFVSHDMGSVLNLCQSVVWLEHGQMRAIGNPKRLSEDYLAHLYDQQAPSQGAEVLPQDSAQQSPALIQHDARWEQLSLSPLANQLQVFTFDLAAQRGFGRRQAEITQVSLLDASGTPLLQVTGGELVTLQIRVEIHEALTQPIVGFSFKDRLGQVLFGDNTYLTYPQQPLSLGTDQWLLAQFHFQMPILPAGTYSIAAAMATGTQEDHQQQHWVHEALMIKSVSSSVSTGLVGLPMHRISMSIQ